MRVLVTGGAGFIGSNFVKYILKEHPECEIVVLDKLTYAGRLENLKEVKEKIKFIKGDICDRQLVELIIKENRIQQIINFAADTHVDRSIYIPEAFIQTNVFGTFTLLESCKKFSIERYVQVSCYDEKTRALTTEGLKTYDKLKEGDKIFSLNPETQEIEVKPIEKVIIQYYKGEMVHFNNQRIDLQVTPNHRMFILNSSKRKLLVELAEKASKRSIFYMPEGHWGGKNEEYFDIEGFGRVKTEDLMYILGIFIGDGFTAYQEKEVETKTGLPKDKYLIKSRDPSTGRFKKIVKQGDHKCTMHSYRIFFDIPEDDRCRKKVEETLSKLGIRYHCHKGRAGEHLYFTSKPLMEFFNQCGQNARSKRIPRWALNYSPKYLKYLLQGLMDSDGSKGTIYHTVSERLASDICELCIKLGLKPSIHKRHTKSFMNGRKIEGDSFYIFVANTIKSIARHRNKMANYDGIIWCVKVKNNKNLLVERNGRFDFCGNTDEVFGSREVGSFKENDALIPSNPYSASKAGADLLCKAYWTTYKLPVIITRSSNNFGPYQYPEKLIPLLILNALRNISLPIYGDGLNVRDWLYVLDNCRAIDMVIQKGKIGEIYNIASGNERKNIEIARLILKELKKSEKLIKFVKDRLGHDRRYSLDASKIKELGWKAAFNFEEALKETIKWYKENKSWWGKIISFSR